MEQRLTILVQVDVFDRRKIARDLMRAWPGLGFDVKNLDEFEKRIAALGINFEAPSRAFRTHGRRSRF
jgi:hypothetical protein